jgi:ParB-like chromosome segregation protein Spo0J
MARKKQEPESTGTVVAEAPAKPALKSGALWEGAVMLPIDNLVFTDWNVNEMNDAEFSELVSEIEDGGFDEPIGVVPVKDQPDHYLVLSGEHRVRACHALSIKEVPAVIKKHLTDADEATIKMWSVKRNNIRGRINAEKFAALERNLTEKHKVSLEAARQKMLVKGELLKGLRKSQAVLDNEEGGGPASRGGAGDGADNTNDDDDGTQSGKDAREEIGKRKKLLAALKNAEEEVLIQSADTVEHGYLFFSQGEGTHLVVNESKRLWSLVKRLTAACKGASASADDFLCAAIEAELPKWEK